MSRPFPPPRPTPTFARLPHALARAVSSASDSATASLETGDRKAVQSIVKTMRPADLLRFNNTSGITINAIIAVVVVLASVFILCILLAAILSRTNAPRHDAFPYAQPGPAAQPAMFQPSAASRPKSDASGNSRSPLNVDHTHLLDSASPLAANESVPDLPAGGTITFHGRSGSSGIGFPGSASAARRHPLPGGASQFATPASASVSAPAPAPEPPQPGLVNYNGREMTIMMAGPDADAAARDAAAARLERERARRSTVVDGPPPATNGKRISKYRMSTASATASGQRMSMSAAKRAQRQSRGMSRVSRVFDPLAADTSGGSQMPGRRRSVTSTGPGVCRPLSMRWDQEEGDLVGRRSTGGRRGTARQSRVMHVPRTAARQSQAQPPRHSIVSADSLSMYESPSIYTSHHDSTAHDWATLKPQQTSAFDPLQVPGPNPFVLASA